MMKCVLTTDGKSDGGVATRTQKWGVRGSLGTIKNSPRKNYTLYNPRANFFGA
eukprot:COSAG02_NODE_1048_length_14977_cov_26.690953_7_plen_53_part_00